MEVSPGYKQTEVGVIPEDWEVRQIQEVCGFIVPGRNKPRFFDGNIPWITTPDLKDGGTVSESRSLLRVSIAEAKSVGSKVVPTGSVVMSCVGELGIVALAGCDIVINQQLHAFLPSATVNAVFLAYVIKTRKAYIESVATKTALPYLNKDNCNSIPIPIPPLPEQEAIAEALSDVDALIESLEQLIAKKHHIKQGAMQELLTGRKRLLGFGTDKAFKFSELGLIPSDWNCFQLPALTAKGASSIKIGPFGSALKKEYLVKEGYKVYGQENVFNGDMEIGDRFINGDHFRRLKSCEIKAGDFLISMMGTVGKCLIVPNGVTEGIMDSHLLRLKLDPLKVSSEFLFQMFQTRIVSDQVKKLSVGGIMEGLSSKIIKSLYVPVTWIEEQNAIAEALSVMDAEITALEAKLTKSRQIKQGMMHNLLTGRIRLV
ncbi:MAG: restriction endonuclease subunit S [Syntrophobacteraceae bacterium]